MTAKMRLKLKDKSFIVLSAGVLLVLIGALAPLVNNAQWLSGVAYLGFVVIVLGVALRVSRSHSQLSTGIRNLRRVHDQLTEGLRQYQLANQELVKHTSNKAVLSSPPPNDPDVLAIRLACLDKGIPYPWIEAISKAANGAHAIVAVFATTQTFTELKSLLTPDRGEKLRLLDTAETQEPWSWDALFIVSEQDHDSVPREWLSWLKTDAVSYLLKRNDDIAPLRINFNGTSPDSISLATRRINDFVVELHVFKNMNVR